MLRLRLHDLCSDKYFKKVSWLVETNAKLKNFRIQRTSSDGSIFYRIKLSAWCLS